MNENTLENHRKSWTKREINKLNKLMSRQVPTSMIARDLGRTKFAIYKKISKMKNPA